MFVGTILAIWLREKSWCGQFGKTDFRRNVSRCSRLVSNTRVKVDSLKTFLCRRSVSLYDKMLHFNGIIYVSNVFTFSGFIGLSSSCFVVSFLHNLEKVTQRWIYEKIDIWPCIFLICPEFAKLIPCDKIHKNDNSWEHILVKSAKKPSLKIRLRENFSLRYIALWKFYPFFMASPGWVVRRRQVCWEEISMTTIHFWQLILIWLWDMNETNMKFKVPWPLWPERMDHFFYYFWSVFYEGHNKEYLQIKLYMEYISKYAI